MAADSLLYPAGSKARPYSSRGSLSGGRGVGVAGELYPSILPPRTEAWVTVLTNQLHWPSR